MFETFIRSQFQRHMLYGFRVKASQKVNFFAKFWLTPLYLIITKKAAAELLPPRRKCVGKHDNHLLDIVEHCGLNKKEEYEEWHFHDRTLLRLTVLRVAFGHLYMSLADHKGTQMRMDHHPSMRCKHLNSIHLHSRVSNFASFRHQVNSDVFAATWTS